MSNWGNGNEKSKLKDYVAGLIVYLWCAIMILFALGLVGLVIYCYVVYGGKPVCELPTWVALIMFRR